MLSGRDAEVGVLVSAFQAAASGAGRVVVVTGAAGIGKSSIRTYACGLFTDSGARVLVGGCPPRSVVAYAPFASAFGPGPGDDFGPLLADLAGLGPVPVGVAHGWLVERDRKSVG